jgi:hypothetical protein
MDGYDIAVKPSITSHTVLFVIACVSLLNTGCSTERDPAYDMGSTEKPASPEMKEFILASQRGFYYLSTASSMKSITDQPRGNQSLHSEVELQCPDRYRLRLSSAVDMERIIIGTKQYERRGSSPWTVTDVGPTAKEFGRCRVLEEERKRQPPDEARVELLAGAYADVQASKGPIREYHGVKCQEYTVTSKDRSAMTTCFAIEGEPYRVFYSRDRFSTIDYDRNQPITIEPPKIELARSKAR